MDRINRILNTTTLKKRHSKAHTSTLEAEAITIDDGDITIFIDVTKFKFLTGSGVNFDYLALDYLAYFRLRFLLLNKVYI